MTIAATTDTHLDAALALAELVPTDLPLAVAPSGGAPVGPQAADAAIASYVGTTSADLALALIDQTSLAAAAESGSVEITDVLRPALDAAARTLGGTGVLGQVRVGDATSLFADPDTSVFELSVDGATAGWFGVRTRRPVRAEEAHLSGARLSRISNVEMSLAVEVGRTKMPVRDVLALEPGAVVELDRSAGAPADVLLNGRVIAKGEVVVVDGGDYGVRITKLLDAEN